MLAKIRGEDVLLLQINIITTDVPIVQSEFIINSTVHIKIKTL